MPDAGERDPPPAAEVTWLRLASAELQRPLRRGVIDFRLPRSSPRAAPNPRAVLRYSIVVLFFSSALDLAYRPRKKRKARVGALERGPEVYVLALAGSESWGRLNA